MASRLSKAVNELKTPVLKARGPTPLGEAGYDNARENIDPHVKTQVLSTKEIVGAKIAVADAPWVKKSGDVMTGTLVTRALVPDTAASSRDIGSPTKPYGDITITNWFGPTFPLGGGSRQVFSMDASDGVVYVWNGFDITPIAANSNLGHPALPGQKWKDINMYGTLKGANINCTGTISGANIVSLGNISGASLHVAGESHLIGKVGVGTAAPGDTLHIVDARTDNENAALFIQHTGLTPAGAAYGIVVEKTGGSRTNVGASFSAVGGDNNYGLIVPNGKVGIGTVTPIEKLDVDGGIMSRSGVVALGVSTAAMSYETDTATFWSYGPDASTKGGFEFISRESDGGNSDTPLTILGDGKVGIGTASPVTKFHVQGGDMRLAQASGTRVYLDILQDGVKQWGLVNPASTTRFSIVEDGPTGNERLTVLTGGNVGIGTATPLTALHIEGASNPTLRIQDTGAESLNLHAAGTYSYIDYSNILKIRAGTTDKVTIDASGNVTMVADTLWTGDGSGLPYGEVEGENVAWTQAAAQNVWYPISDATMDSRELHLITHDGNGKMTVTKGGRYLVNYSITTESTAANDHLEVAISGAAVLKGHGHTETKFANEEEAMSGTCIIDLAAGTPFEAVIRTTDPGTPTLTVEDLDITAVHVGGT